jgi:hypothetical protein
VVLFFVVNLNISCSQNQDSHTKDTKKENIQEQSPTQTFNKAFQSTSTPFQRILPSSDPNRPGYIFIDSFGKEIKFLSNNEIFNDNPYKDIILEKLMIEEATTGFYLYDVKDMTRNDWRKKLSKKVIKLPSSEILSNSGMASISLTNSELDHEKLHYLAISYAIVLYDKESLTQLWAETTIFTYDRKGEIYSKIIDTINILNTFISSDGRYLLTSEYIDARGDGTNGTLTRYVIYDVPHEKKFATINAPEKNNSFNGFEYPNYEDSKILFWGLERKGPNKLKFVIDLENRLCFKKAFDPEKDPFYLKGIPLSIKSENVGTTEDLSSYQVFHFE